MSNINKIAFCFSKMNYLYSVFYIFFKCYSFYNTSVFNTLYYSNWQIYISTRYPFVLPKNLTWIILILMYICYTFKNNSKTLEHFWGVSKILHIIMQVSDWESRCYSTIAAKLRVYNSCTFYTCMFEHETQRHKLSLNHSHNHI